MASEKVLSKSIVPLKEQGIHYLTAATKVGVGIQAQAITQSGGAPLSVVFAEENMSNMEDMSYVVMLDGETASRVTIDESTKTVEGFDILGGLDGEVIHVLVVGPLAGQMVAS